MELSFNYLYLVSCLLCILFYPKLVAFFRGNYEFRSTPIKYKDIFIVLPLALFPNLNTVACILLIIGLLIIVSFLIFIKIFDFIYYFMNTNSSIKNSIPNFLNKDVFPKRKNHET